MNTAPLHFISDLHLDQADPGAIGRFLAYLGTQATEASALYILGDLFEAWVGDDDDEPQRNRVCDGLKAFTASGRACYVMRGNRDFLLNSGFEQRTGCRLLNEPVRLEWGALRLLLMHGDTLCTADHSYQELRSIVRTPGWSRRFRQLPLATRRELADAARAGSRAHTERTQPYIMDVTPAAVEQAFRISGCDVLIHGHTHRPATHALQVDGRSCVREVLPDWYENGGVLVVHADGRRARQSLGR